MVGKSPQNKWLIALLLNDYKIIISINTVKYTVILNKF